MKLGKFNSIVDSAWGSSGKGAASSRLAAIYDVEHLASGNYPNAGHTFIHGNRKFVGKCLPTGAALMKSDRTTRTLWIGPNSGFELEQLTKEIIETGYNEVPHRFKKIHGRAMIVTDAHKAMEAPSGSRSTEHISSTMSGAGAALTEKAMRRPDVLLARNFSHQLSADVVSPMDFVRGVRQAMCESKQTFLMEVSQGWALSLNHGTHYPTCTSRDCTPQQAYADFGILPRDVGDVYLNVRSMPIRVGNNYRDGEQVGYSGDGMPDQSETSWAEVGRIAEMPQSEIDQLSERERTTVTKKVRRVFTPSWQLLRDSAEFCGATKLILNFPQYLHWSAHKVRGGHEALHKLHPLVRAFVDRMEETTNLPVCLIGTGADHDDYIFIN